MEEPCGNIKIKKVICQLVDMQQVYISLTIDASNVVETC